MSPSALMISAAIMGADTLLILTKKHAVRRRKFGSVGWGMMIGI
jgi:hypothetical protein